MAIMKKVRGCKDPITIPAFSFSPNEGLAQLIVEAWTNDKFGKRLLARDSRKVPTDDAVALATATVMRAVH